MNKRFLGLILVFIATACWGSAAVFIRFFPKIDAFSLVWVRYFVTSFFLLGLIAFQFKVFWQSFFRGQKKWILINSLCMIGTTAFMTMAVKTGTVAAAVFLLYVVPLFVTTAYQLLADKKPINSWLSVSLSFSALGVLSIFLGNLNDKFSISDVWGILAGISWGVQMIVGRKLSEDHPGFMGMFLINVLAAVLILPLVNFGSIVNEPQKILLVIYGLIASVVAGVAFYSGIKYVNYTDSSVVSLFDPIIASAAAFIFLKETPSFGTFIGCLFIIVGNLIQIFTQDFTIPQILNLNKTGPYMGRYAPGSENKYTVQLMREQEFGFILLMLYYKRIKNRLGEKQALELLTKASIERRISWWKYAKKEMKKEPNKSDLESAIDLVNKYQKEVTPVDISGTFQIIKKETGKIICDNPAWCPICEAAIILGLDRNQMCGAICIKVDEWLVRQYYPKIRIKCNILPDGNHRAEYYYEN